MIGNNINKNEYLISDANRFRARIGENFASLQQVSSRKLTPENLNKHLSETNKFFKGDATQFSTVSQNQEKEAEYVSSKEKEETTQSKTTQETGRVETGRVEEKKSPLVAVAEEAYASYSSELEPVKAQMKDIFGSMGEIQARAKNPVSAANRLQRVLDNGWAKEISTKEQAMSNLWDAIGSRVIVKDTSPEGIQKMVDSMSGAIKSGKLEMTSLNNLRGPNGKAYFSPQQLKQICQADYERRAQLTADGKESGPPIKIGGAFFQVDDKTVDKLKGELSDDKLAGMKSILNSKLSQDEITAKLKEMKLTDKEIDKVLYHAPMGDMERGKGSPFTSVCAYVKHGNGVTGELQIIGPEVLKIANAEHLPYDAMIKKDLYRELSPEGKEQIKPYFQPFEEAMANMTQEQKDKYNNEYLNQCYVHARNKELGVQSEPPSLPEGLSPQLSMENIFHLHEVYSDIKKKHPKE